MALVFFPSAGTRVEIVCVSDPSIREANPPLCEASPPCVDGLDKIKRPCEHHALARYERDGDIAVLVVPLDASRLTIAPLTAPALSAVMESAGALARPARLAQQRREAGDTLEQVEDAYPEAAAAVSAWNFRYYHALARFGLRAVSDWPDVVPVLRGKLEAFPEEHLNRLLPATIAEVGQRVERISRLTPEGKAPSASRSGGRSKARAPSRARTAKARSGKR